MSLARDEVDLGIPVTQKFAICLEPDPVFISQVGKPTGEGFPRVFPRIRHSGDPLVDGYRRELLDQVVHLLGLGKKVFELAEGEGAGAVAFGLGGIGVGFEKEPADALTHACEHEFEYRLPAPIGGIASSARNLEGVGDAEDNRATGPFHDPEIEGVDDQVVVPEGRAAFAKKNLVISRFRKLFDDVSHLMGGKKLSFLDVDRASGLGQSDHEVGLAAKEGGELEGVDDFGGGFGLVGFVNVGDYGNGVGLLDLGKDFQALFQSGAPKGRDGRAVGFVEGCLEGVGMPSLEVTSL